MNKIAIYARVSDMKLKEDGTRRQDVERQVDMLKAYCKSMGWEYTNEFIYRDDGLSAWTDDLNSRPGFSALRSDMLRHKFDKVLVESLDRFSSELASGLDYLAEYGKNNIHVISLQLGEHEVTSDEGWMKSAIFLLFAEYRVRNLRSKVISGMERRRNKETAICGFCKKVHMGRHPLTCQCTYCLRKYPERKGGVKITQQNTVETINQVKS